MAKGFICRGKSQSQAKQTPSSKLQRNFKLQISNMEAGCGLEIEIWSFSGAWCLEFGALIQICDAAVRLRMTRIMPIMLSLYCGSACNCFQTGAAPNADQCFLCSSAFSPHVIYIRQGRFWPT